MASDSPVYLFAAKPAAVSMGGTVVRDVDMPDPRQELSDLEGIDWQDIERSYHGSVLYGHYWYDRNALFARLVERVVETANTGMVFSCEHENDELRDKHTALARWWATNVNRELAPVANLAMGMTYLNGAAIFNGVLEGMYQCLWTMRPVNRARYPDLPSVLGEETYALPMRIVHYSAVNGRLASCKVKSNGEIALKDGKPIPGNTYDDPEVILIKTKSPPEDLKDMQNRGSVAAYFHHSNSLLNEGDSRVLALPWERTVAWKFFPTYNRGMYPSPMTRGMFTTLEKMALLNMMDKTTIRGFIRQLWVVSVGNESHEIVPEETSADGTVEKPGDMQQAAELFDSGEWVSGCVLPWYYKIEKIGQNDRELLDYQKFLFPLLELYAQFGLTSQVNPDERLDAASVTFSIQGFIDMLDAFRTGGRSGGLKAMWESVWLNSVVADPVNQRAGITMPLNIGFRPMTLNGRTFLEELKEAYMQGLLANETYTEALGFDSPIQRALVEREGHVWGDPRISYLQRAETGDGTVTDTGITRNQQPGRPREKTPDLGEPDLTETL